MLKEILPGNRPEESTSVQMDRNGQIMSAPFHDRFDYHMVIELDKYEWLRWGLERNPNTGKINIHPVVLAFCISKFNDVMYAKHSNKVISEPRLSPRRWEKLSKVLYKAEERGGQFNHVSKERIAECIGNDYVNDFISFYNSKKVANIINNIGEVPLDFISLIYKMALVIDEEIPNIEIDFGNNEELSIIYEEMRPQEKKFVNI